MSIRLTNAMRNERREKDWSGDFETGRKHSPKAEGEIHCKKNRFILLEMKTKKVWWLVYIQQPKPT